MVAWFVVPIAGPRHVSDQDPRLAESEGIVMRHWFSGTQKSVRWCKSVTKIRPER